MVFQESLKTRNPNCLNGTEWKRWKGQQQSKMNLFIFTFCICINNNNASSDFLSESKCLCAINQNSFDSLFRLKQGFIDKYLFERTLYEENLIFHFEFTYSTHLIIDLWFLWLLANYSLLWLSQRIVFCSSLKKIHNYIKRFKWKLNSYTIRIRFYCCCALNIEIKRLKSNQQL